MLANLDVSESVACPLAIDALQAICNMVLAEEGVTRPCYVSVTIVDDVRMRELNRTWRQQDRPTDVLSLECERPDDPDLADGEPCELGDIVLAPAYIARQAATFGTTANDEFRLLLIHGLLHLLGYDHLQDDEAEAMEAREDALLAQVTTDRPLRGVSFTRHDEERAQ